MRFARTVGLHAQSALCRLSGPILLERVSTAGRSGTPAARWGAALGSGAAGGPCSQRPGHGLHAVRRTRHPVPLSGRVPGGDTGTVSAGTCPDHACPARAGGPEDVAGRCSDACQAACASPSPPGATVRRRFSPAEASGSGQGGAAQTGTSVTRVRFAFRRGARVPSARPGEHPTRVKAPAASPRCCVSRSFAEWRYCGPARAARARGSLGGWGEAPVKRGLLLGGREREAGR